MQEFGATGQNDGMEPLVAPAAALSPGRVQLGSRTAALAEVGVTEVIVGLPPAGADVVLPLLDRAAELVGAV